MTTPNPYCDALKIQPPSLAVAAQSREANVFALLIVALLENGHPMTLEAVARRFEEIGVASAADALESLKKCRPARPPVYRDGDLYALDSHDDEVDLWLFRLGLRPPRVPPLRVVRPPTPEPLAGDEPLTVALLDEVLRHGLPSGWSAQRLAILVLGAHGRPMPPAEVLEYVRSRCRWSLITADSAQYWRSNAAVRVLADGSWAVDATNPAVASARAALRERLILIRRYEHQRQDPAVQEAISRRFEADRAARAAELAVLRRVIVHAYPANRPRAAALLDVAGRSIRTFLDDELAAVVPQMESYDFILGVDVRALLRGLGVDPGSRRLGELGPPQKSMRLNRQGRTLKITLPMLIQGSCGISRPFGVPGALRGYLDRREEAKLRRRLEADIKSLFALYQYGCVHGAVRLRWGFLDEMIPAPWRHRDEELLFDLLDRAAKESLALEVVTGSAPGWADPWSRARRAIAMIPPGEWCAQLVDEAGYWIDLPDVQAARVV